MRKIHTGLPALIVDTLAGISLTDFEVQIEKSVPDQELWDAIDEDNKFKKSWRKRSRRHCILEMVHLRYLLILC